LADQINLYYFNHSNGKGILHLYHPKYSFGKDLVKMRSAN